MDVDYEAAFKELEDVLRMKRHGGSKLSAHGRGYTSGIESALTALETARIRHTERTHHRAVGADDGGGPLLTGGPAQGGHPLHRQGVL